MKKITSHFVGSRLESVDSRESKIASKTKVARYLTKMRGGSSCPPRPAMSQILFAWIGGCFGIAVIAYLSSIGKVPLLMAPFGATCVLAFGVSDSPLAQPRNIIGGHVLSTFIGLVCLQLFGPHWWVMAIAVATSIAGMQFTRTVHPPAGADPLVVILSSCSWNFLLTPVLLGSIALVLCAVLFNNLISDRSYPKYWI